VALTKDLRGKKKTVGAFGAYVHIQMDQKLWRSQGTYTQIALFKIRTEDTVNNLEVIVLL
jgi:muconolactone delta-isomerase